MTRPPPGSTRTDPLFPDTTLFRSVRVEGLVHARAVFDPAVVAPALGGASGNIERPASRLSELGAPVLTDRPHFLFVCHRSFPWLDEGELLCAGDALEALGEGDRKSTRLNSSH